MGKNVILPEQTVRDLLEAYASLSAWYYQLWGAVRSANGNPEPPTEQARAAFLSRLAHDYPEIAAIAKDIPRPRPFVPPPPALPAPYADLDKGTEEPTTIVEPAANRQREGAAPQPPAFVPPGGVKY